MINQHKKYRNKKDIQNIVLLRLAFYKAEETRRTARHFYNDIISDCEGLNRELFEHIDYWIKKDPKGKILDNKTYKEGWFFRKSIEDEPCPYGKTDKSKKAHYFEYLHNNPFIEVSKFRYYVKKTGQNNRKLYSPTVYRLRKESHEGNFKGQYKYTGNKKNDEYISEVNALEKRTKVLYWPLLLRRFRGDMKFYNAFKESDYYQDTCSEEAKFLANLINDFNSFSDFVYEEEKCYIGTEEYSTFIKKITALKKLLKGMHDDKKFIEQLRASTIRDNKVSRILFSERQST